MAIIGENGEVRYAGAVLSEGSSYLYSGQYSYWVMVWDEAAGEEKQVGYGWSDGQRWVGATVKVDATDEVKAKVLSWKAAKAEEARRKARSDKARALLANREIYRQFAKAQKVSYAKVLKLAKIYGDGIKLVLDLFKPRVRNDLKLSFKQQVLDWLKNENPKYKAPLSPKQFGLLVRWNQPYRGWQRY
jgi:hypothetical protein